MSNEQASWGEATTEESPQYEGGNSPVEPGRYPVFLEKVELKLSQANKKYINLQWRLQNNRVVFQKICASSDYKDHKNQKWVQQQFNSLKRLFMISGVGVPENIPTPSDIRKLQGINCDIKVGIDRKDKDKNVVIDSFPFSGEVEQPTPSDNMMDDIDSDDIPF